MTSQQILREGVEVTAASPEVPSATPHVSYLLQNRDLVPPVQSHEYDAGRDLRSSREVVLRPRRWEMVETGLFIAIPVGHAGLVLPRSGLAWEKGIGLVNSPGLIDPGYRGEIKVLLINHGRRKVVLETSTRIAQLVIVQLADLPWQLEELPDSSRGESGFGSTGLL